jgi:hypothetical protein
VDSQKIIAKSNNEYNGYTHNNIIAYTIHD